MWYPLYGEQLHCKFGAIQLKHPELRNNENHNFGLPVNALTVLHSAHFLGQTTHGT